MGDRSLSSFLPKEVRFWGIVIATSAVIANLIKHLKIGRFVEKRYKFLGGFSVILHQPLTVIGLIAAGWIAQTSIAVTQTPDESTEQAREVCSVYHTLDRGGSRSLYSPFPTVSPSPPDSEPSSPQADDSPLTEAEMREAIEVSPGDSNNYSQLGNFLEEADRQSEAITVYQQWIENASPGRLPYLRLGNVLLEQGQIDQAVDAYRKALETPIGAEEQNLSDILSSSSFQIAIGDLLQLQGEESAALEIYIQGVEQNFAATAMGDGVLGNSFSASTFQPMLNAQQAERVYRNLIQALPNAAFGYYRLVELLASQNRFDEAIALYQTWIPRVPDPPLDNDLIFNIDPDSYMAGLLQQKSNYLREIGNFDEAVTAYRAVLNISPDNIFNRIELAETLVEQGDLETAVSEYRQLTLQQPYDGTLYVSLGNVLACQGRIEDAIAEYTEAAARGAELPAYHFLGDLLVDQGKLEEAARAFRAIIEIHSLSELGLLSPGTFQQYNELFLQQKWQEAIALYRELVESTRLQPRF
jgi:tetratricopeptide (TPR) repeat protein